MKKNALKLLFTIFIIIITTVKAHAVQFDVLVLPTELFSVCDNYFCFPEVSEIVADNVINNLNSYQNITAIDLAQARTIFESEPDLKSKTENMLNEFEKSDKIDFQTLKLISDKFNVKSILLISSYSITDQSTLRRNLWETLEISNAFKISYQFTLVTNAVLTDTVNNVVMLSNKFSKNVSDSNGYFLAGNQAQAASQLEKIKLYSQNNISQNISQNIHLRFFPKEVRTFNPTKPTDETKEQEPQFVPNALENLIKPKMLKEIEDGHSNTANPVDDFIFEF